MCHAKTGKESNICIYCGSKNHRSGRCINKPNDNWEEPRTTPRILQEGRNNKQGNINHNGEQNSHFCQQARFDKNLNRQYYPNYANFHPSPIGSIPGQDLSATLIELVNIQSRSLEMMVASQRSQQEASTS